MKEVSSWVRPNSLFGLNIGNWGVLNSDVPPVSVAVEEQVDDTIVNLYQIVQNNTILLVEEITYTDKTKTMQVYELDSGESLMNIIESLLHKAPSQQK